MTPTELASLEALAKAATKGKWRVGSNRGDGVINIVESEWDYVCECFGYGASEPANAAYIAAFNPAAILSLIEEYKRMREALSALYAAFLSRHGSFPLDRVTPEQCQWNDAMLKANDLLRLS